MLLLRVPPSRRVRISLSGPGRPGTGPESLAVSVNGGNPERLSLRRVAGSLRLRFDIAREQAAREEGRLQIRLGAPADGRAAPSPDGAGFAFSELTIRIG